MALGTPENFQPAPLLPKHAPHPAAASWKSTDQRRARGCSENCLEQKLRTPRRRCQQPKMLNSPEDNMYYNQLNGTLEYQGSKRKPRKFGQIKVLDGEDEYYKSLSAVDSIPEEDSSSHCSLLSSSSQGEPLAES
ncbi:myosin-IIIb-like [Gracilinanus agilis]|uniref:myosin-IIIb-like n=1 Tax=Gracilinanus agilis TaxID=191870 RepID=UPI001CFE8BD0|nr:myosin-IIIb-like [Gracilinanus agilis]